MPASKWAKGWPACSVRRGGHNFNEDVHYVHGVYCSVDPLKKYVQGIISLKTFITSMSMVCTGCSVDPLREYMHFLMKKFANCLYLPT
jgi:hypothetical protein